MYLFTRFLLSFCLLSLAACSNLLPRSDTSNQSPWQNFEAAKVDYDKIVPNQTTKADLKKLGFDPFVTPNITLLNYLDLTTRFIPNSSITLNDLPPMVQKCLQMKDHCQGYAANPQHMHSQRFGNVALDLLNFRRETRTSGWRFETLLVLLDDTVVYKLWGGDPNILKYEKKNNPLGPLQEVSDLLTR